MADYFLAPSLSVNFEFGYIFWKSVLLSLRPLGELFPVIKGQLISFCKSLFCY